MSIGTATATVTLSTTKRTGVFDGIVYRRNAVTVTITGQSAAAANLYMAVYRNATLVAACNSFSASGSDAVGTLDTNTTELQTAMTDLDHGVEMELRFRLWNTSTLELVADGRLNVRQTGHTYAGDTGDTSAVPSPSGAWTFEVYEGKWCFVLRAPDGTVYSTMEPPGA